MDGGVSGATGLGQHPTTGEWLLGVFMTDGYSYIMPIGVCDHSGHVWAQAFNEVGEQIVGKTAQEMADLKVRSRMT